MISLRRATAQILRSKPSAAISNRARLHNSSYSQLSRPVFQRTTLDSFQRRFATENAFTQTEPEEEVLSDNEPPKTEAEAEELQATSSAISEESLDEVTEVEDQAKGPIEKVKEAASEVAGSVGQAFRRSERAAEQFSDPALHKTGTVYVGNLFFDVRGDDLQAEFAKAGEVKHSNVVMDRRGLSKGFGYVDFGNVEAAERAIEMFNMQTFNGRMLTVQHANVRRPAATHQERPPSTPSKTLFIGNLSYTMSDRELNTLFREIKDVIDVRVAIDRRTGQPRGFAHADFHTVEAAERAFDVLNNKVVAGRTLRTDFSRPTSGRARLGDNALPAQENASLDNTPQN